eukprot:scaffold336209_cov17-Prasinocladus_malaysianus.AAC.1
MHSAPAQPMADPDDFCSRTTGSAAAACAKPQLSSNQGLWAGGCFSVLRQSEAILRQMDVPF